MCANVPKRAPARARSGGGCRIGGEGEGGASPGERQLVARLYFFGGGSRSVPAGSEKVRKMWETSEPGRRRHDGSFPCETAAGRPGSRAPGGALPSAPRTRGDADGFRRVLPRFPAPTAIFIGRRSQKKTRARAGGGGGSRTAVEGLRRAPDPSPSLAGAARRRYGSPGSPEDSDAGRLAGAGRWRPWPESEPAGVSERARSSKLCSQKDTRLSHTCPCKAHLLVASSVIIIAVLQGRTTRQTS